MRRGLLVDDISVAGRRQRDSGSPSHCVTKQAIAIAQRPLPGQILPYQTFGLGITPSTKF
jgi:hypothetical protein